MPSPSSWRLAIRGAVWGCLACSVALVPAARAQPAEAGGAADPPPRFERLPGAREAGDGEHAVRLAAAAARLLAESPPRTEHLHADGSPRFVNRLVLQDSPYLRQHAFNPVDWHPWGEEAFERARAEDKPVFLSIGYSTCHWCHVMERESFDDLEIARLLNERFVCIKVDREERPDVDDVYMTAVQLMTSRAGGWPLSVFLTPEGRPFFGGTYSPPDPFAELLDRVWVRWNEQRPRIEEAARRVHLLVDSAIGSAGAASEIDDAVFRQARDRLLASVDRAQGGFGGAPKFPQEPSLLFLARHAVRHHDVEAGQAVTEALEAMARGGIHDQVGGGFHRYATDRAWRVPHFEKMLYTQAQLARAYTQGWRLTGKELFRRTALDTLEAAERELGAPGGGYHSALDADSVDPDGELTEGAFYTWTTAELIAAAGPDDAELALRWFGATSAGDLDGRNVLHRPRSLEEAAAAAKLPSAELGDRIETLRARLREARERRPAPLRDEKLITAWNGMMIAALADAGIAFESPELVARAVRAAERMWAEHRREDGRLWRLSHRGSAGGEALLEDYAELAAGFLGLDRAVRATAGGERAEPTVWWRRARQLADVMLELFVDADSGGFLLATPEASRLLISRPVSLADGAVPAAGSVAVGVLAELAHRGSDPAAGRAAERAVSALASSIERRPQAFPALLASLDLLRFGELGTVEHGGGGVLRAALRVETEAIATERAETTAARLRLRLDLAEGWHVNAHSPLAEDLAPTVLRLGGSPREGASEPADGAWRLEVDYPAGERLELGFREGQMAVYSDGVELLAELVRQPGRTSPPASVVPLELEVQICNDRLCLEPETLVLELIADDGGVLRSAGSGGAP